MNRYRMIYAGPNSPGEHSINIIAKTLHEARTYAKFLAEKNPQHVSEYTVKFADERTEYEP